ncbi:hypothetical protein IAQ61_003797 [Plenodomus lingam]|uniref:uncharacterized protein n=1 Tax=Leptosphaeria maculans TaxID=5022 RepID=UPI003329DE16|nr:hypothetical protein IAQ61_003797 [Plenodomus lingam]
MVFHLTAEAGGKRESEDPNHHDPSPSSSLFTSPQLNAAPREQSRQNSSVTNKHSPVTPQPNQLKRSYEAESLSVYVPAKPILKRPRSSADTATATPASRETQFDNTEIIFNLDSVNPGVLRWIQGDSWPKEYFESKTMSHLLKKKLVASLRRKRSESSVSGASSTTPSDQKPREFKSAPYQDPRYLTLLQTKRSYMTEDEEGPRTESRAFCRSLLTQDQDVPPTSRFSEGIFQLTCSRINGRNEAKVIQDITRLIVPSAEELADFGAKKLCCLVESVNEGWNNSIPLTGTRPQPDYSVGFKREAFSQEQLEKLAPLIGDFIFGDQCYFMATYYMYFPFLTCEVKCGAAGLEIANRQNAHSMTLAVRAVVELFRLVKREKEVEREILAFSVSHDNNIVQIYGHYAVIDGSNISYYRHPIYSFDFTTLDGKERWTTYKFTKSVYDTWMPMHFKRICSAIDDLPAGADFDVPPLPQDSGL